MLGEFTTQMGRRARASVAVLLAFALVLSPVTRTVALAKGLSHQTQVVISPDAPHESSDQSVGASDCPNCAQSIGILLATAPLKPLAVTSAQAAIAPPLRINKPKPATPPPRLIGGTVPSPPVFRRFEPKRRDGSLS